MGIINYCCCLQPASSTRVLGYCQMLDGNLWSTHSRDNAPFKFVGQAQSHKTLISAMTENSCSALTSHIGSSNYTCASSSKAHKICACVACSSCNVGHIAVKWIADEWPRHVPECPWSMKFWLVGPRRMQIAKLFLGEFEYIFALRPPKLTSICWEVCAVIRYLFPIYYYISTS